MRSLPTRRRIPHSEHPGGAVCLTWRLRYDQPGLSDDERGIVLDVIRRSDPLQCNIVAAVVMNDHVHALVRPAAGIGARYLASSWKSISSHAICRAVDRRAPLWQRNYFDRWMRSPEQVSRCADYVLSNPFRRWPERSAYPFVIRPS